MTEAAKIKTGVQRVWKSAQMFVAFHRDQNQRQRAEPKLWPPKNGSASINENPEQQEAVVVVKGANPEQQQDVQIKLHPERIVMRREAEHYWQGIAVDEFSVSVRMADGTKIEIGHDGSIKRTSDTDRTSVEADGAIFKWTQYAEAHMTGDGTEMSRKTEDRIATITKDGILDRARREKR